MLEVRFLIGELICTQIGQELNQEYFKHRKFVVGEAVYDYAGNRLGKCEKIETASSGFKTVTVRVIENHIRWAR